MSACIELALGERPLPALLAAVLPEHPDLRLVRDVRERRLRLRLLTDQRRGTWEVWTGKNWRKVAAWPGSYYVDVCRDLPLYLKHCSHKQVIQPAGAQPVLLTVGELLRWYAQRHERSRAIGQRRKVTVGQHIDKWLMPKLGAVPFALLTKAELDARLIQPLQADLQPATIRAIYNTLCAALNAARGLHLLPHDQLHGMTWRWFKIKTKPKKARLFPEDLRKVLDLLAPRAGANHKARTLALLMLMHGTRIGETSRARWSDFDLLERVWVIPDRDTKTDERHVLPLTAQAVALLEYHKAWQQTHERSSLFLFPGRRGHSMGRQGAGHLIKTLGKIGAQSWSSHDLRKLARASWVRLGVDYLVGEVLLNHALPGLAPTYVQTDIDRLKREALELWHGPGNDRGRGLNLPHDVAEVRHGRP